MTAAHRYAAILLFCTLALPLIGCGPTPQDRLAGKWKGSLELDTAAVERKVAEASDPVAGMVTKAALTALGSNLSFEMDLQADGTFSSESRFNALSEKSTGTWAVKTADANQATIAVTEKTGTREYVITFDPDFMKGTGGFSTPTWGASEGLGKMRFVRLAE